MHAVGTQPLARRGSGKPSSSRDHRPSHSVQNRNRDWKKDYDTIHPV